jgi:branched-chain amino acid transport system ATP-binding protein
VNAATDLIVSGLTAGYGGAMVLHEVSMTIVAGRVTCILGANGAGKSTLIRAIVGLGKAAAGDVTFAGRSILGRPTHEIAALGVATVAEGNRVFPKMSVLDNLKVGAMLQPDERKVARKIEEAFVMFPRLRERCAQYAGTLSGGERSMLSIARGLMTDPRIIIFDEPSLGLSPLFVGEVFKIMRRLKEAGMTILLVEQNVRQTLDVADYGYVLSQGRVVSQGPTAALMQDAELRNAYFGNH